MRLPASGRAPAPSMRSTAATISSGSAMRPMPASPRSAISPAFGPTMATPSSASCATIAAGRACAHIAGFIAGAMSTCVSVASRTAVARSSAWPPAILAMRSAVAGATTMRSVSRAKPDMPDVELAVGVEQIGEDPLAVKRAGRQRRDELLRRRGEDAAHRGAALLEPADEVERLVGRDAAADDQENAPVRQRSVDRSGRHAPGQRFAGELQVAGFRLARLLPRRPAGWCGLRPPWNGRCARRAGEAGVLRSSSSWRMVMVAIGISRKERRPRIAHDCIAINAIIPAGI